MILSILIPTIPERRDLLARLLYKLHLQIANCYEKHSTLGLVEILIDDSKRFLDGGLSIGDKRNTLVQKSTGTYLCFLDDDDNIAPNYVEQLIRLCGSGSDIVTFRCFFTNDHYWTLLNMSLENSINQETNSDGIIQRTPWHICPMKSELAKKETFSSLNHNEDWDWMKRVLQHIKSQEHTDMILTLYNHSEKNSEADKILQNA